MRRALTTVTLGAVLLTGAACSTKSEPTAAATSAAPSPSADYSADTKKVCGEVDQILDGDFKKFGEKLGEMIVYKEAGNTAQTAKAKASAQSELKAVAASIREKTSVALDPELKAGGEEAAANMEATAAGDEFFAKIKTLKDLDSLETEMTAWLMPLATFCA